MKYFTFSSPQIPAEFKYPAQFHSFCASAVESDISPWYIFDEQEDATFWLQTLCEQYPDRKLVPFARDESLGDELACFDASEGSNNPRVHFVHCFASPGWENRGEVADFTEWLKLALEDHQEFHAEDEDDAS